MPPVSIAMRRLGAPISRRPRLSRWLLAGPVGLITALVIMMAMTRWLPPGPAHVDHIVIPVILFPLIWAAVFFYACIEENLPRCGVILAGLLLGNLGLLILGGAT